ncbi:MAG: TatD family hydrolase, partial [Frankia sp.]
MARSDAGRRGDPPPAPDSLPVDVIDSHCHLDLMVGVSIEDAVAAARTVGIRRMVTVGVDVETSRWQADAAAKHPDVYAAVAIHPNEAPARANEEAYSALSRSFIEPERNPRGS